MPLDFSDWEDPENPGYSRITRQGRRLTINELKRRYGDWTNGCRPSPGYEHEYIPPKQRPQSELGKYSYGQFLEWAKANGRPPRPSGAFETELPRRPPTIAQESPEQARQRIISTIGPEAFDAIPNAPAASISPLRGISA